MEPIPSGQQRDPLTPIKDAVTADGDVVAPIDVENFGLWLKAVFGAPTTAGATPKTHTFRSGDWTPPGMAIETAMPAENGGAAGLDRPHRPALVAVEGSPRAARNAGPWRRKTSATSRPPVMTPARQAGGTASSLSFSSGLSVRPMRPCETLAVARRRREMRMAQQHLRSGFVQSPA